MLKKIKVDHTAVLVLTISFLIFFLAWYQLTYVCLSQEICSAIERRGLWNPLKEFSFFVSFVILPFLFLPQRYFRNFFIHFISWGSILTLVLIAGTKTTTMIDRMDMVYVSVVFWVVAATFSIYRTWYKK